MRFSLVLAATLATASGRLLKSHESVEVIEGEYIVVLKANTTAAARDAHMGLLKGAKVMHAYESVFNGYAVKASQADIEAIAEHPDVDYVEANGVVRAFQTPNPGCSAGPANPPTGLWGLSRVSYRATGAVRPVQYSTAAQGANIYILDTGINYAHTEFDNRATFLFDATGEGPNDGNGHGTHCAGTAGGRQYGIAKTALLFDVKVLNRQGSGSFAGVISGIETVTRIAGPRIASLSLGGGIHQATNQAITALANAGGFPSIASGNSNANACNSSPASAPGAFTVNALANTDARAGFSNFGSCTHIFAPGQNILSAWIGSTTATNTISGTSMACPHVTGLASDAWGRRRDETAQDIMAHLRRVAIPNVVTNPGANSPNLLAQSVDCALA